MQPENNNIDDPLKANNPVSNNLQPSSDLIPIEPSNTQITSPAINQQSTPLQPYTQQANLQDNVLVPNKSHKARNILLILIGFVLLAALGYWIYLIVAPKQQGNVIVQEEQSGTVPAAPEVIQSSDLSTSEGSFSSYLYPKAWTPVSGSNLTGYESSEVDQDGLRSRVALYVSEALPDSVKLASESPATISKVRTDLMNSVTKEVVTPSFLQSGAACTSEVDLKVTPDEVNTPSITGLYYVGVSCEQANGGAVSLARFVLGKDGRNRSLLIIASDSSWERNKETYTNMLNSLNQINL